MNVTFLIAITSTRKVGELEAMMADSPLSHSIRMKFLCSYTPSFFQRLYPAFISNSLHTCFLKPRSSMEDWNHHYLNVCTALAFYPKRMKQFRKSSRLSIAIAERIKEQAISTQTISKWISGCIMVCYWLSGLSPFLGVQAHSTRVHASTVAILHDVPLPDICRDCEPCGDWYVRLLHITPWCKTLQQTPC